MLNRLGQDWEPPFVPAVIVGFLAMVVSVGEMIDLSMSPVDAVETIERMGGRLVGTELHLPDNPLMPHQLSYMVHLADRVCQMESPETKSSIHRGTR